jgi:microcystin-dependent protein
MATVTGFTAAKMQEIIDDNIVDARIDSNYNLILVTRGGQELVLGNVRGEQGQPGPGGSITSINGKTGSAVTLTAADLGVDLTGMIPVGTMVPTGRSSAPSGYVLCQGQSLSRTGTYAALFAAIGSAYTPVASSTNFNVPDLRARVPVGRHTSYTQFDTLGEVGGEMAHVLTNAEMPAHGHTLKATLNAVAGQYPIPNPAANDIGTGAIMHARAVGRYVGSFNLDSNVTNNQGGGGSHNNLQPYQVVNWMIKY